jgi:hypothetical protein
MNCANCTRAANYLVGDATVNSVYYCSYCLPEQYRAAASRGAYSLSGDRAKDIADAIAAEAAAAPSTSKKASSTTK